MDKEQKTVINPDKQSTRGHARGDARVVRGGSWNNNDHDNFRCANRNNNKPDNRNNNKGFRCSSTFQCRGPGVYGRREITWKVQVCSRPKGQIPNRTGVAGSHEAKVIPGLLIRCSMRYGG